MSVLLRRFLGLLLAWVAIQAPVLAQDGPGSETRSGAVTPFEGSERVTAVDVMVGLELGGKAALKAWGKGLKLPEGVDLEQFEVTAGGKKRPVVALEEIRDDRPVAAEPWTLVIFIDGVDSRTRDLAMGLEALAQRSDELIEIGVVQVVWRRWVEGREVLELVAAPTRDGNQLRQTLAKLALNAEGEDALASVRYGLRRELLDEPWTDRAAVRRIERARREEAARALAHQDTLLTYLVDAAAVSGPRRAVFWVTGGFDTDPSDYYGPPPADDPSASDPLASPDLQQETDDLARTLAAYGWIVYPVGPPPPDPLRGKGFGVRLGKWRFTGLMAQYESQRLPKRAEAYLELGEAHRRGERWEDAAEAYDRAYFHFWGDPRTKDRQALALARLGEVLDRLGQPTPSRRALEMAVALDRTVAETALREQLAEDAESGHWAVREADKAPRQFSFEDRLRFAEGAIRDRHAPLRRIASVTSGQRLQTSRDVREAVDDLRLRLRLTLQLSGPPTGELLDLDVRWAPRSETPDAVRFPAAVRFGVPARLSRAMARRLLADGIEIPGAGVEGILEVVPRELVAGSLLLDVKASPGAVPPRPLRVVVAAGGGEQGPTRSSELLWTAEGSPPALDLAVHEAVLSVLWQDIDSGRWGAGRYPTGLD